MKFKRAENCGPVPYPDQSGKMLIDEVVEGDGWAELVTLGFVVPVDVKPGKRLPQASKPEPAKTRTAKTGSKSKATRSNKVRNAETSSDSSESIAKNAILGANESPGDVDVVDDRNRANGVDSAPTRSADAEDPSE